MGRPASLELDLSRLWARLDHSRSADQRTPLASPTERLAQCADAEGCQPFARAKWHADRHTTLLEQAALADFLHDGHLERHVRRMRRLYKQRRVLMEALGRHFGDQAEVLGDAAGMHVVVRFRSNAVSAAVSRNNVHLASTRPYYVSGAPGNE